MADTLETMFQNPVTALWAGQREGIENLKGQSALELEREAIRREQQAYAQRQLTNPLDIEQKQWTNRGLEADLPGKRADSSKKVMETDTYKATQPGLIDKTNSINSLTVLENNLKRNDALVDLLGKGAKDLEDVPDNIKHAVVYEQLMKMGGQEAVDAWKSKLNLIHPSKLPALMNAYAQHSALGSTGMRQKIEEIRLNKNAQKEIAAANNATQLAVVDKKLAAQAKVAAAKTTTSHLKMTDVQASNYYTELARVEKDADAQQEFLRLANQARQGAAELAAVNKPDLNNMGVSTVPQTPRTLPPLGPVGDNKYPNKAGSAKFRVITE